MELILSNCIIPTSCVNDLFFMILNTGKINLLDHFSAYLENMRILSIVVSEYPKKFIHVGKFIPSYYFLEKLDFSNLLEFFHYITQLYANYISDKNGICCKFMNDTTYSRKELVETWLLDGHVPCTKHILDTNYNILFHDYIYDNYPTKFADSFGLRDSLLENDGLFNCYSDLIFKNFVEYIERRNLDIELLYSNNYIGKFFYEKYNNKFEHLILFSDKCTYDVKHSITVTYTQDRCYEVTLDNNKITGKLNNNFMFELCNKIDKFIYICHGFDEMRHSYDTEYTFNSLHIEDTIDHKTFLELEEYIITKENTSNFTVINLTRYLPKINIDYNTIIYFRNSDNEYINITEYKDIIKLVLENNELVDVIDLMNGNYKLFNEQWLIQILKCSIVPNQEIINVFNSIHNEALIIQFIKLLFECP